MLYEVITWVIDYKTSRPRHDEDPSVFLQREGDRYAAQVATYVELFGVIEPQRRVVGALYFPYLDRNNFV